MDWFLYDTKACNFQITLLHGCFSRFLNCANGTKWCKASHLISLLVSLRQSLILVTFWDLGQNLIMALLCRLHCAILKALNDFKITRAHQASQYLLQNVEIRSLKSSIC